MILDGPLKDTIGPSKTIAIQDTIEKIFVVEGQ